MTKSDLSKLDPSGLIAVIEEAQRLLDETHPLNPTQLKCPKCGYDRYFRIEGYQWLDWEPHGASADNDSDPAWGAESACNCPECNYPGRVLEFMAQQNQP